MGEKKVKGRKRHIVTDTQGHLLAVNVHAANLHDTTSGGEVFGRCLVTYPTVQGVCADAGYRKTFELMVQEVYKKTVEIVKRLKEVKWAIIPKRWVVERTFGWMNGSRRLSKDVEITVSSAEAQVKIAHCYTLFRRMSLS
jgi:putative transposase